jgi:hypothetical protein
LRRLWQSIRDRANVAFGSWLREISEIEFVEALREPGVPDQSIGSPAAEAAAILAPACPPAIGRLRLARLGQKLRFDRRSVTSGLPNQTNILSIRRHVSTAPKDISKRLIEAMAD